MPRLSLACLFPVRRDRFRASRLCRATLGVALGAALAAASPATAEPVVKLMFGEAGTRQATVAFAPDRGGAEAITITTHRVGAPGSRLVLRIDQSRAALVDRVLGDADCGFDDAGSRCMLAISGGSPDYARIVTAFRLGRTLHVEITTAGSMEMAEDISLLGFTRAYGAP
jgi:hypothetical protein